MRNYTLPNRKNIIHSLPMRGGCPRLARDLNMKAEFCNKNVFEVKNSIKRKAIREGFNSFNRGDFFDYFLYGRQKVIASPA
jgi:hypothetical protein